VRGTKGFSQREQFMTPLQDKVADVNLEAFFTAVQNVGDLTDGLPSSEEVDVGRKVEVVSTIKSIVLFQNLLRQSESVRGGKAIVFFSFNIISPVPGTGALARDQVLSRKNEGRSAGPHRRRPHAH